MKSSYVVVAIGSLLVGCSSSEQEPVGEAGDELRKGQVSNDLTSVGAVRTGGGLCTGTLVASNVVLTAAHCISHDDGDGTIGQVQGSFEITLQDNAMTTRSFDFDSYYARDAKVFGGGKADVALLHLTSDVPPITAKPIRFATRKPKNDERVYQFGYGCQSRNDPEDEAKNPRFGQKQMFSFLNGDDHEVNCPGDSGGPSIIMEKSGGSDEYEASVFRVTSAYGKLFGDDQYASVVSLRDELKDVIATWNRR